MTTASRSTPPRAEPPPVKGPHDRGPRPEGLSPEARPADGGALEHNVRAIAEMEHKALHNRSTADRVSDAITRAMGSTLSPFLHVGWFSLWVAVNVGLIPVIEPFDPFPFSFLTLTVSLEAIFLTLFVLMSQNRMARLADQRAHLDLQVDLLAEQELTAILTMVRALCKKLDVDVTVREEGIDDLLKKTDIHHVAAELEECLPDP